jgi:hypothetical protein
MENLPWFPASVNPAAFLATHYVRLHILFVHFKLRLIIPFLCLQVIKVSKLNSLEEFVLAVKLKCKGPPKAALL